MRRAVFCDFDGTITQEDTFADMLRHFVPEVAPSLLDEVYGLRVPLTVGIRQLVQSIPSSRYDEVLDYIGQAKIRAGLDEFLDFLEDEEVPFYVVSGGLTGMVSRVLGDRVQRVRAIYAPDVNLDSAYLKLTTDFESEQELLDKVQVMALHPADDRVAIGNSLTDLRMAQEAEIVFARDRLSRYLDDRTFPYTPWESFLEVRDVLRQRWREPQTGTRSSK